MNKKPEQPAPRQPQMGETDRPSQQQATTPQPAPQQGTPVRITDWASI